MRGMELIVLSVLLLSAQQMAASAEGAVSSGSILTKMGSSLTDFAERASSAAFETQVKSAMTEAGCSARAVDTFRVSYSSSCIDLYQASVNYQQFFLNFYHFLESVYGNLLVTSNVLSDGKCTGEDGFADQLECYVDRIGMGTSPTFKRFLYLVHDINDIFKSYQSSYQNCLAQKSSMTKYWIFDEDFESLEPIAKKYCPVGTTVDHLTKLQ